MLRLSAFLVMKSLTAYCRYFIVVVGVLGALINLRGHWLSVHTSHDLVSSWLQVKIRNYFWWVATLSSTSSFKKSSFSASHTLHQRKVESWFKDPGSSRCFNLEVKKKSPLLGVGVLRQGEAMQAFMSPCTRFSILSPRGLLAKNDVLGEQCLLFIEKGPLGFLDFTRSLSFPF